VEKARKQTNEKRSLKGKENYVMINEKEESDSV